MKILLCYATAGEGKIIKEQIKNLNLKINLDISYLCTGMGMYETIFNLTKILNSQTFDIVLNIGVCGYLNEKKKAIQVARTVNMTTRKELIVPIFVQLGSLESIGCSENVITSHLEWKKYHPEQSEGYKKGGNYILRSRSEGQGIKSEGQYFDMESWGIEYVCDKFRVPRVILKVPVDKVGEEVFDKEKASKMLAENLDYREVIQIIVHYQ